MCNQQLTSQVALALLLAVSFHAVAVAGQERTIEGERTQQRDTTMMNGKEATQNDRDTLRVMLGQSKSEREGVDANVLPGVHSLQFEQMFGFSIGLMEEVAEGEGMTVRR
jgi:hypothetical protein